MKIYVSCRYIKTIGVSVIFFFDTYSIVAFNVGVAFCIDFTDFSLFLIIITFIIHTYVVSGPKVTFP